MNISDLQRWYAESKIPELSRVNDLSWSEIENCIICSEPIKFNQLEEDAELLIDYGVVSILIPKYQKDNIKHRSPTIAILDKKGTRFIWRIMD